MHTRVHIAAPHVPICGYRGLIYMQHAYIWIPRSLGYFPHHAAVKLLALYYLSCQLYLKAWVKIWYDAADIVICFLIACSCLRAVYDTFVCNAAVRVSS